MKYLLIRYILTAKPITFMIKLTTTIADSDCSMFLNVAIHNIRSMTIKSWTISIPMLNLPYVDSIFSLSPKSFNTTIVLLKANHIAKKQEVIPSNQRNVAMPYPMAPVIRT